MKFPMFDKTLKDTEYSSYRRTFRRGMDNILPEFSLIALGFNLHKLHLKHSLQLAA